MRTSLSSGKSSGVNRQMPRERIYVPPGKRFGRLVVIRDGPSIVRSGQSRRTVICKCDCGMAEIQVRLELVMRGTTRSCGCLRREAGRNVAASVHGMRSHPLYPVWIGLRRRSRDRRSAQFGALLHQPWYDSPRAFVDGVEAELGPRPEGAVLALIRDDGDFEPGNIRWISQAEHRRNRRSILHLVHRIEELERENRRYRELLSSHRIMV